MSKNSRNYPKTDEEETKGTVRKLRSHIKQLEKYVAELKSENQTLVEAWAKTESFLEDVTDGIPLEDVLKYKKLPKRALQKKKKVDNRIEKDERLEVLEKWQKWNKNRSKNEES